MAQFLRTQVALHPKEAVIHTLRTDALEEAVLAIGVIRSNRSELDDGSIAKQHIELEFLGVLSHADSIRLVVEKLPGFRSSGAAALAAAKALCIDSTAFRGILPTGHTGTRGTS